MSSERYICRLKRQKIFWRGRAKLEAPFCWVEKIVVNVHKAYLSKKIGQEFNFVEIGLSEL